LRYDGSSTFLSRHKQIKSVIDLIFVSPSLLSIANSNTLSDNFLSDHFPVSSSLNHHFHTKRFFSYKIRLSAQDNKNYLHSLLLNIQDLEAQITDHNLSPLTKYHLFLTFVKSNLPSEKQKAPSNVSIKSRHLTIPPAPWWNGVCEEALLRRKEAISSYKNNPTFSNYLTLKRLDAVDKRTFKKGKRKGWRDFCLSLSPSTPIAYVWRIIKSFKNRQQPSSPSYPD